MNIFKYRAGSWLACIAAASLAACGGGGGGDNASGTAADTGLATTDSAADTRAAAILSGMSLSQKIQLVHGQGMPTAANTQVGIGYDLMPAGSLGSAGFIKGIAALGIPDMNLADSNSGVLLDNSNSTALPSGVALAATFSTDLAQRFGKRIGLELRTLGLAEGLGGGLNLAVDPKSGRTFENFGEDPILTGELGASRTIGVQSQKVISTLKHFAFNNHETNRYVSNSVVDEQTMRETELLAFEIGITKGQPGNVMCAYNQVNGTYSCENAQLLGWLKNEWGYKGIVQSDWGATASTTAAATAGLDEEQPSQQTDDQVVPTLLKYVAPGPYFIDALQQAVTSGEVPLSRLDDMVKRKLRTMIQVGVLDNPPTAGGTVDEAGGNADALAIAQQSIVLLKNAAPSSSTTPVLPLASDVKTIVVIGGKADVGVLAGGGTGSVLAIGGSADVSCLSPGFVMFGDCASWVRSVPLDALKARYPSAQITFYDGSDATAAANAAAASDVAIVFATSFEGEGLDVSTLALSSPTTNADNYTYDQDELIEAVAAKAKKTIVVLETGGPVLMPWVSQVHGIVEAWYPGIRGAQAIVDVLSGDVNPSGKTPITFPVQDADEPMPTLPTNLASFVGASFLPRSVAAYVESAIGTATYDALRTVDYGQQLLVGYKWFDAKGIAPLFPFGHGLSYTSFAYSGLSTVQNADGSVTATFTVTNTGALAGTEIAQLYASLPAGVPGNVQPPKRLVGWGRATLAAGASTQLSVVVPRKYLSTWDATTTKAWLFTPGNYVFTLAPSADTGTGVNVLTKTLGLSAS